MGYDLLLKRWIGCRSINQSATVSSTSKEWGVSPFSLRRTLWGYGFYRIQSDGEILAWSIKSQADGATSGSSSSSESTIDDSVDTNSERLTQPSFLQLEEHPGLVLTVQNMACL
jgi:hypothetical protein